MVSLYCIKRDWFTFYIVLFHLLEDEMAVDNLQTDIIGENSIPEPDIQDIDVQSDVVDE